MSLLWEHDAHRLRDKRWLIGVDEAGRGALAGPVVAAACVVGVDLFQSQHGPACAAINDSKQLGAPERERQAALIETLRRDGLLDFELGRAGPDEIERLNILGATKLAMERALRGLAARSSHWALPAADANDPLFTADTPIELLVDGRPLSGFPFAHEGLVKGDGRSLCIAMASILAKVTRDRMMTELERAFPGYGFAAHKGYGTCAHRTAIGARGPSAAHRPSFLGKILANRVGSE